MQVLHESITLTMKSFRLSDEEFFRFCVENEPLKFERDEHGNIIVMANTGGKTGRLNMKIAFQLEKWNMENQLGEAFDSSTAFRLENTAVRSPDAAWVSKERWARLTETEKEQFPPICPDFVIELLSVSDEIANIQNKMREWIANGCRLAWLINPYENKTYIYKHGEKTEIVESFEGTISGDDVLKGFVFDLSVLK
ncbi:MAG: Uma2 family endonuclease [Thermoflexibacter sp.]|jgi:Uma2 family endonuclease|nr:Uma2 family endonuclease [Thermoflexibacter sp.]